MTTIDAIPVRPLRRHALWRRWLTGLLRACFQAAIAAHRRRQTRKALDRLDDRALKDIGLARGATGYERLPD